MDDARLPFDRDTHGATYGAILHEQPVPPSQSNLQLLRSFDGIIGKALEKIELRYQHASEIRADLQRLKRDSESGHVSAQVSGAVSARQVSNAGGGRKIWSIAVPVLAASLLLVCSALEYLYFLSHRQSKRLTEKDTIVLADFSNSTGDADIRRHAEDRAQCLSAAITFLNLSVRQRSRRKLCSR